MSWVDQLAEAVARGWRFEHGIDCPAYGDHNRRCMCGARKANKPLEKMAAGLSSPGGLALPKDWSRR